MIDFIDSNNLFGFRLKLHVIKIIFVSFIFFTSYKLNRLYWTNNVTDIKHESTIRTSLMWIIYKCYIRCPRMTWHLLKESVAVAQAAYYLSYFSHHLRINKLCPMIALRKCFSRSNPQTILYWPPACSNEYEIYLHEHLLTRVV